MAGGEEEGVRADCLFHTLRVLKRSPLTRTLIAVQDGRYGLCPEDVGAIEERIKRHLGTANDCSASALPPLRPSSIILPTSSIS